MPRISMNIIWVGAEQFTTADETTMADALTYTRGVYASVGVLVDRVEHYEITNAEAGGYVVIDQDSEAEFLTVEWTVPNNAIDVFVVQLYVGSVAGLSPVPGPCDKDLPFPHMTGTVVELVGSDTNQVLAHEVGHYLGLDHVKDDSTNLMFPSIPNGGLLTSAQGATMKTHCFIEP
jgi:Matrixin